MRQTLKSIGSTLLGVAIFIGLAVATILFFTVGAKFAFFVEPYINWLAGVLFAINLIVLLIAIAPKARAVAGAIIFGSSYIYGIATWIFGLAVTLTLWGWIAVIIGIVMGGVGVVPIGMLAAIFHGHWDIFLTLCINIALTYGARIVGVLLVANYENQLQDDTPTNTIDNIIDLEPEPTKRIWKDIE